MPVSEPRWRPVALSMALGGLYDLAFAVVILGFPARGAALLGLILPEDPVYLRLNGVFLLLIAGMYGLAALDAARYRGVVVVAIAGRTAGFVYLGGVWLAGWPVAFLVLGLLDLGFALLHGALLLGARRSESAANA